MAKDKKFHIVFLTVDYGSGHRTATKGLIDGLEYIKEKKQLSNISYETVNIVREFFQRSTKATETLYEKFISLPSKVPTSSITLINSQKIMKFIRTMQSLLQKKELKKWLSENIPDCLVSTSPYVPTGIFPFARQHNKNISLYTIITDSQKIHRSWIFDDSNMNYVLDKESKRYLIEEDIDSEKISVSGFPLPLKFYIKSDRTEILRSLGLDEKRFTIACSFHHRYGTSKYLKMMKILLKECHDRQFIIITGKNNELSNRLGEMDLPSNFKLLGWVSNMPEILEASDLYLTRPGGASLQECITKSVPPVLHTLNLWWEQGNIDYVRKYRIGVLLENDKDLGRKVKQLSSPDSIEYRELKRNMDAVKPKVIPGIYIMDSILARHFDNAPFYHYEPTEYDYNSIEEFVFEMQKN